MKRARACTVKTIRGEGRRECSALVLDQDSDTSKLYKNLDRKGRCMM